MDTRRASPYQLQGDGSTPSQYRLNIGRSFAYRYRLTPQWYSEFEFARKLEVSLPPYQKGETIVVILTGYDLEFITIPIGFVLVHRADTEIHATAVIEKVAARDSTTADSTLVIEFANAAPTWATSYIRRS